MIFQRCRSDTNVQRSNEINEVLTFDENLILSRGRDGKVLELANAVSDPNSFHGRGRHVFMNVRGYISSPHQTKGEDFWQNPATTP